MRVWKLKTSDEVPDASSRDFVGGGWACPRYEGGRTRLGTTGGVPDHWTILRAKG